MAETFGAELSRLRDGAGLTLRQLADRLNVDHTYLSHIESGRRVPGGDLITRIATFFGADPEILGLRAGHLPPRIMERLQRQPEQAMRLLRSFPEEQTRDVTRWCPDVPEILEDRIALSLTLPGLDFYDRPPFASHIKAGKNTSIYSAHSYHTKVPYQGIIPYIEHYTEPGDLVVDPFCGSGMTGVATVLTGRDAILYDISPAAVHIARNYTTPCDPREFEETYQRLRLTLGETEQRLYTATCDVCGGDARIEYTIFTDIRECATCRGDVSVWRTGRGVDGKLTDSVTCPTCHTRHKRNDLRWLRSEPCLLNLSCLNQCSDGRIERTPTSADLKRIVEIEASDPPAWVPSKQFGRDREMWRKGHEERGITNVRHFFTTRNLHALSIIHERIRSCENPRMEAALLFAFTGCVNRASKRYQWNNKRPTNVLSGTLYVSSLFYEFNVFGLFDRKVRAALRLFRTTTAARGRAAVVLGTATNLGAVPDESVDYVFTDPPFGSNIFYADCSLLWEAWLGEYTDVSQEIVVSRSRTRTNGGNRLEDYQRLLTDALIEIRRILKPDRWASVVFHNSSALIWEAIRQACLDAGFTLSNTLMFDKRHKSFKGLKGAQGTERVANYDVVLNLRRSVPVIRDRPSAAQSEARIIEFIHQHLLDVPDSAVEQRTTAFLHSLAVQEAMRAHLDFAPTDLKTFIRLLEREFAVKDGRWSLAEVVVGGAEAVVSPDGRARRGGGVDNDDQ